MDDSKTYYMFMQIMNRVKVSTRTASASFLSCNLFLYLLNKRKEECGIKRLKLLTF